MRTLLMSLIAFVSMTALGGGAIMIYEPDGSLLHLPVDLLEGTPFTNFLLPGLALAIFIGGVNFFALVLAASKERSAYRVAVAGGFTIIVLVVLQMLSSQTYHWLQILYLLLGQLIVLLSYQLMGKAAF